jgi:hypothetical protein
LVIGFRKASVLLVLAFYLKILLMAPLLLVLRYCRHWVGCDGPASGIPNLERGRSVSALNLAMDGVKGK